MKQVIALGSATVFLLATPCGSSRAAASFAYVGNNDLSSISVFHVDPGTGMLTLLKTVDTAAGGATYCEFHPSGRFMFVSGQFSNVLSTYAIDTGGLPTLVAGSTVATGLN